MVQLRRQYCESHNCTQSAKWFGISPVVSLGSERTWESPNGLHYNWFGGKGRISEAYITAPGSTIGDFRRISIRDILCYCISTVHHCILLRLYLKLHQACLLCPIFLLPIHLGIHKHHLLISLQEVYHPHLQLSSNERNEQQILWRRRRIPRLNLLEVNCL